MEIGIGLSLTTPRGNIAPTVPEDRITEDEETRITEDGETRETE